MYDEIKLIKDKNDEAIAKAKSAKESQNKTKSNIKDQDDSDETNERYFRFSIYSTIFRAKKLKSGFKFTSDASSSKEATGSSKAAEEEDVKIEEEKEIPQK